MAYYISHITVHNFRCHSHIDIPLCPTVNTLTGRSGLGKTAGLISPLKWVVFNEPLGTVYRKWNTKETYVSVTLTSRSDMSDWILVTRRVKGGNRGQNSYEISTSQSPDPTVITNFGSKVPDEVTRVLNLSSINFQYQHDEHYLLGMNRKPFELARELNRLAGMTDIDSANEYMNKRLVRERDAVSVAESDVKKYTEEMDSYSGLGELAVAVRDVEEQEAVIISMLDTSATYDMLAGGVESAMVSVNKYRRTGELGSKLNFVVGIDSDITTVNSKLERVRASLEDVARVGMWMGKLQSVRGLGTALSQLEADIADYQVEITRLQNREEMLLSLAEGVDKLHTQLTRYTGLLDLDRDMEALELTNSAAQDKLELATHYTQLTTNTTILRAKLGQCQLDMERNKAALDSIMPDVCPVCGRPIERSGLDGGHGQV